MDVEARLSAWEEALPRCVQLAARAHVAPPREVAENLAERLGDRHQLLAQAHVGLTVLVNDIATPQLGDTWSPPLLHCRASLADANS